MLFCSSSRRRPEALLNRECWPSSLNNGAKHNNFKKLFSVLRTLISLDPGLRRDDEQKH
jgi:hypothetical protein